MPRRAVDGICHAFRFGRGDEVGMVFEGMLPPRENGDTPILRCLNWYVIILEYREKYVAVMVKKVFEHIHMLKTNSKICSSCGGWVCDGVCSFDGSNGACQHGAVCG